MNKEYYRLSYSRMGWGVPETIVMNCKSKYEAEAWKSSLMLDDMCYDIKIWKVTDDKYELLERLKHE